jgi:hypothetical protein
MAENFLEGGLAKKPKELENSNTGTAKKETAETIDASMESTEQLSKKEKIAGETVEKEGRLFLKIAQSKKAKNYAAVAMFLTSAAFMNGCITTQGGYSIENWTSPSRISTRYEIEAYKNEKRRIIDERVFNEYEEKRAEGRAAFEEDLAKGKMRYLPSCTGNAELICGPWCVGYEEEACQYKSWKKGENIRNSIERGRRDAERDYFEQQQQRRNNTYKNYDKNRR